MSNLTRGYSSGNSNTLAECHGASLPDLNRSFWDMFAITAAESPHKEAVVSCSQRSEIIPPHATLDADGNLEDVCKVELWEYHPTSRIIGHLVSKSRLHRKEEPCSVFLEFGRLGSFLLGCGKTEDAVRSLRPKSFRQCCQGLH
jgi:hypothetical protein